MKHVAWFALSFMLVLFSLHVQASPSFTYTGRILDPAGVPVISKSVRFTLTIYEPTGKCWLYTEQRELDLSTSSGSFSIDIGSNDSSLVAATSLFNGSVTGPQSLTEVFDNAKSFSGLGIANGCTGTYTPNTSAPTVGRLLSVFFSLDGGPAQALPVLKINPVPSALQAYNVNGYGAGVLLKVDRNVNQATNDNNALSQTQYDEFWRLVKNPIAAYLPTTGDVTNVSGNNKVTSLLGQALPVGPAASNQVLVSNGTAWTLQTMNAGSVTSVSGLSPLSSSGGITPTISISQANSTVDGYLSSADWNAFNSKQSNSLADGSVWVGNASGGAQARIVSGDATLSSAGVLTLASTISAGGPVGTSGYVPVITYDAKGRLTTVTSAAVNDASKLPLAGGTMSGAVNMGGQDLNNVGNINMAANKYLSLSTNSTDGTVAGQMWYDGGAIKYYDGSSVKSLGVAGAGIANLNGLSAGTQSFAIGTFGNSPAFNSVTSTHTLNIPMASVSGAVTAGLISNAEYTALNAKQSNALASANVWVGNASGGAQARAVSGDISLDSAGATSLVAIKGKSVDSTAATTMGQILFFDSVADKWKVSVAAAPANGQVMKWNDTAKTWEPGNDAGGWTAVDASYAAKGIVQFDTNAATSGINVSSGVASVVRTTTGTANTILALDAFGTTNLYGLGMLGSVSGTVLLKPSATTSTYALTLPNVAPNAGQSLQSDASGNFTWVDAVTTSVGIVKDGNSFGGDLVIGTNDNYNFSFESNGTTAMTIKPNGNVGIGTADPIHKFYVEDTTINNPDKRMVVGRAVSQSTVDGAYTSIGSDSRANEAVATGVTNTGPVRGAWIAAQRNAQLGIDDEGTLTNLEGAVLQYGHFAVNAAANPQTTNVYGIKLDANYRTGTITNLYDLYIGAGTGSATVTNRYSIYQANSSAKNYLNGSVGIGALTPATKLDVSGVTRTTGLDLNAAYGGSQLSLRAPGAFTSYTLTLPTTVGTSGQFLQTNGVGALTWVDVTTTDATKLPLAGGTMSGAINMGGQDITNAGNISMVANKYLTLSTNSTNGNVAGQMWYDAGIIKYYDGGSVRSLGVAGAGITNINGLTSAAQTFAIGTSGDAPAFSSATNTHTLNIPLASSAGTVTAGLLSNAEYAALSNKQSATLANGQVWVGNASNVATATNPATLFVMKGGQAGAVSLGSSDANNLTLLTNNTTRVTIDSSGNIGIGAGSLLNKPLDVVGTGATIAGLKRTDDSDGFNNILSLTRTRSSTTLPGAGFGGSIAFSGEYDNANNTTAMGFIGALWESNQTGALANANSAMTFSTALAGVTNEHVRITSQGRVGINTPSPSYPLSVAGTIESTSGGYRFPDGTTQTTAATNVSASTLTNAKIWVGNASNKPVEVSLSGDATIANTGVLTVVKTTTGTSSTIVSTDGTGTIDAYGYGIKGTTSGTIDLLAQGMTSNYALRFPAAAPGANQILESDASGNFTWISKSSITDASKLPLAGGTMTGDINMNGNDLLNLYLGAGRFFIGNASNGADTVLMSGDATMSPTGVVTVDKTTTAVASKILQLTASSVAVTKGADIGGASTGIVSLRYPSTATNTTLTFPSAAGSANQFLQTNGSGTLTWASQSALLPSLNAGLIWVGNTSNGPEARTLSGDVSAVSNTGAVTVVKSTTGTANQIVALDGSSIGTMSGVKLPSGAFNTTLTAATTATGTYVLRLPPAQGAANQVMQNDGSGNLSWVSPVTTSTGIVKDGNSFGAHLIIGTNDNYDFRFESNGATAMTIEPSGEVGIGTTTPGYKLDVATTDGWAVRANTYSATASQGSNLMLHRARGTAAAPTAVQANDTLGGLYARGYGASSFGSSSTGYVEFSASQTFTEANRGTYMSVYTTADNSSSPVERVRIADDGYVGIGTTNPTSLLHVGGGNVSALTYGNREVGLTLADGGLLVAGAGPEIVFKNNPASGASAYASIAGIGLGADGSGTYGGIAIATKKATTGATLSESMRIDNNGNVGIGTTSPLVGLMVEKDNGNGYAGWFRKSNTSNGVGLGSTAVGGVGMIQGLTTAGGNADLVLNPIGGEVGIGINPNGAARLQISATPTNSSLFATENVFKGEATANGTYYHIGVENNITKRISAGVTDSGYLVGMRANTMRNFVMGGTDSGTLATITGAAVQYGHYNENAATTPQTTTAIGVQVVPHNMTGNIGTMYDIMVSNGSTGGTVGTHFGLYVGGASKTNFFDGELGIGTNNPDQKLVVYNGSTFGKYTTSGWTHSSDVRLKNDIQPLNGSLNKILQLDGVSYKFKSDPEGKKQVGFIAQQVEPIFPEVVTTDKDGMKSMIYSNLVAPLVESVKALYAKITAHDEKFKQLEAENQAMKEALCELGKQQFCSQK